MTSLHLATSQSALNGQITSEIAHVAGLDIFCRCFFGLSTFLGHLECHQQTVFEIFKLILIFFKTHFNPNTLVKSIMLIVKPLELHDFRPNLFHFMDICTYTSNTIMEVTNYM